jgi:HK97 family phage portal protein
VKLVSALRAGLKAFRLRFVMHSAWNAYLPRTSFDYLGAVGDGTGSSTVMAPLLWICRTFPESPTALWRILPDGQYELQPRSHPMLALLRRPNPFFTASSLWVATVLSYYVSGNSYWLKVRGARGEVRELWWVPNWSMKPAWPADGSAFISHYEYRPGLADASTGAGMTRIAPEDVIHFRFGVDPDNIRLGLSPLASVLREVFTDDEGANFTSTLLRNMGVPGLLVAPSSDDAQPSDEDVKATKSYLSAMFTGDRRGEPLVMSAPTKIEQFGFSPEQLNLRELRRIPEERVSACLGVPAIVAGLGAGLDRSTYTNFVEARAAAYESNIIPAQRVFAEELDHQLLPEFEPQAQDFVTGFDRSEVSVLQEDRGNKVSRLNTQVAGGWMKVSEARREVGLEVDASHEVYLRPLNLLEVPADGLPRQATTESEWSARALVARYLDPREAAESIAVALSANGNGGEASESPRGAKSSQNGSQAHPAVMFSDGAIQIAVTTPPVHIDEGAIYVSAPVRIEPQHITIGGGTKRVVRDVEGRVESIEEVPA